MRALVKLLCSGLRAATPEARRRAARSLRELGPKARGAEPAIVRALGDPEWLVRGEAAIALGHLRTRSHTAVEALGKLLENSNERYAVRCNAASALALIGEPGVSALVHSLRSRRVQERRLAVGALDFMGPAARSAVPDLVKALADDDPNIRHTAASALGSIGKSARTRLEDALQSTNRYARVYAASAILRMEPWHPCHESVEDWFSGRRRPKRVRLTAKVERVIGVLADVLREDDPNAAYEAARVLAEIGPAARGAAGALQRVRSKTQDTRLRAQCGRALRQVERA